MTTPLRRARLIYNPTSGREEMQRRLPAILQKLEKAGIETTAYATEGEGDASLAAAEAARRGYDYVIAAGGDGTINEVINGLAEQPERPALGILPMGTTNDFARALGIPKHWEYALDVIAQQYALPVDIGKANGKYFINIAGAGSLTELTYEVPSKLKTLIGQLAYYIKGLEKVSRLRPVHVRIESADLEESAGGIFEDEVMLMLISNSNSVGGFEKLVPNAALDDGLFDVLLLRKSNLADLLRVIILALRGDHLSDPLIKYFRARELRVTTTDYVQINLDGEYGGTLPVTFTNLRQHVRILVDEAGETTYQKAGFLDLFKRGGE